MNFSDMVTQSVFARAMAIIILSIVMLAAVVIGTFDFIAGREIPTMISTIIGIGIGIAGNMIGINFGVVLQPASQPQGDKINEK